MVRAGLSSGTGQTVTIPELEEEDQGDDDPPTHEEIEGTIGGVADSGTGSVHPDDEPDRSTSRTRSRSRSTPDPEPEPDGTAESDVPISDELLEDPRVSVRGDQVVVEHGEWEGASGDVRGRTSVPFGDNTPGGKVVDGDFMSWDSYVTGRVTDALTGSNEHSTLPPVGEDDPGVPEPPSVENRDFSYLAEDHGQELTASEEESVPGTYDPVEGGGGNEGEADADDTEGFVSDLPPEVPGGIGGGSDGFGGFSLPSIGAILAAAGVGIALFYGSDA